MRGEQVLASVEVARTPWDRARGLLGRSGLQGALLIHPARAVHTIGMRFPIDVAFCTGIRPAPIGPGRTLEVIDTVAGMSPNRLGRARWRARCVIEAEAGSFERWGLEVGDVLEIRD